FVYKFLVNLNQLIKDRSFRLVIAFAILAFPVPIILTLISAYYLRLSSIPISNVIAGLTEAILLAFIGILALITFSMHFELELKYNWVVLSISSVVLIIGEIGELFSQSYWPEIPLWIFHIFFNFFTVLLIIGLVMFQSEAAPYKSIKRLLKEREQFLFLNQELNQLLHDIATMTQLLRHDLINDFAVIQSFIDLYLETKEQAFLERIKNRLKDATQRLEQVKSSTDIFVGLGLKPIDVTALKDVASLFSNISVKIPDEPITVLANQIFFTSIYNIILNAFEHGGPDTHVTLEVIEHPKSVEIIIADTGVGISADDKSIVFDLKYKGTNSSGEGIALYLIKNYIERIGGTITVTDNKPKGAKFIIKLPKTEYII
ncbi:MAG: sensor histidine kinase, partial [Candidatus Heimdallarchaeaceae archaeon]